MTLTRGGGLTAEQIENYDRDGYIVIENLLDDDDMAAPRAAMMDKTERIARDLLESGSIPHNFADEPFATRLARLFDGLSDDDFLKYGRSWREPLGSLAYFSSKQKSVSRLWHPQAVYGNPT